MRLTDNERPVLVSLVNTYCEDFGYVGFAYLMRETGLPRPIVRRACRSLKRKGMAEFCAGLWTEDGTPAGSGYRATEDGQNAIKATEGG